MVGIGTGVDRGAGDVERGEHPRGVGVAGRPGRVLQRAQVVAARLRPLHEDVEALARRQQQLVARCSTAPSGLASSASTVKRGAVEAQAVPDVGAHVAESQQHRLPGRRVDDRVHLTVDGARRRRVGVDVLRDDRRALELEVAEREQVLGHVLQCRGQALGEAVHDQRAREPGEHLLLGEPVQVRVVPVGAGRDVGRDLDAHRVVRVGRHDAQHVVGDADRRRVQPVRVEVRLLVEVVLQVDLDVVTRVHHERRPEQPRAVGLALHLLARDLVRGLVHVERRPQHAALALDDRRLGERLSLHRRERRLDDPAGGRGGRRAAEMARVRDGRRRGRARSSSRRNRTRPGRGRRAATIGIMPRRASSASDAACGLPGSASAAWPTARGGYRRWRVARSRRGAADPRSTRRSRR